ncbi:hypothetical protein [Streptomyces sp. NPDC057854]|uniref:hypothetical protein n=1 Tax=unclassified Streptomyces TaxID=2593676 RepID=UPI0036905DF7
MARNLFGGTADSVAEDATGTRVPHAVGTVWDGPSAAATQLTDLTEEDGAPLSELTADEYGYIAAFYGPEGYERVWLDFGGGRVALAPINVAQRLREHASDPDAHQLAERFLDRTTGGEVTGPVIVRGTVQAEGLTLPGSATQFTQGAVITAPAGTATYVICALPKAAQVVGVRGYRSGGTGVTINALRNGLDLLPVDLSLSTDSTWLAASTIQNATAAANDALAVSIRNVAGSPAYVSIQIDLQGA